MIARKRSVGVGVALLALVAACASTAERRPTAPRVEPSALDRVRWDAATGRLGCAGGYADLTLDPELRERVRVIAPDLVVVVLPQVNSALMVTVSPSSLRGKRAGVLGDLPEIWKELHRQATGVDLRDGDFQGTVRAKGGRIVAEYTSDPPPPTFRGSSLLDFEPTLDPTVGLAFDASRAPQWRLVYREVGRCRIAAVDRGAPGDPPRLTPLLDELRVVPELITK
jgi:hypothetical protein